MSKFKSIKDIPVEKMGAPNIDISKIHFKAPEIITDEEKKEIAKVKRNLKGVENLLPASVLKALAKSKLRKKKKKILPVKNRLKLNVKVN